MAQFTWASVLTGLLEHDDMDAAEVSWAMDQILSNNASPVQVAGFLVALRAKGETVGEIRGMADVMLDKAVSLKMPNDAVDVVGSGGDRANTVNISTMAAIVAAASGRPVIKHGNRAASSMSGTADCLEALGLVIDIDPAKQPQVFDQAGISFLFAPLYHASLRFAAPARKELGIQTTFNFLGPLANPARPQAQAIGVANFRIAGLVAGVLADRGNRGLVFHGKDGLDELTTTGETDIWLIRDGAVHQTTLDPAALGLAPARPSDLVGGDPAHNAQVARDVFAGQTGPVRDIVGLNAAAAMLAFDGPNFTEPLVDQMRPRLEEAFTTISQGRATELLERWVAISHEVAGV
ncbi:anthranilate phosphoribosyltransferase [Propionibacterium freudenreichii]|uniref:anthranilate phosphoribosyltransferase n=1 Tax=Propionibacterium freudenreichii TaxID=1744 RepID=UPI000541F825|nr:anthranilate phosphoribosyltransferase [Propionibacterium freudenreichii]AJQ91209.1 Anthranilate phosphoribosyltransferase [Propionibacterium freudenreichii subsp. freudenreichii]MDK9341715.1 anthranilate phosphoribosyltransferase [Propionibacterium freudenreichii]CEG91825.1 Anthranilate phosphoribosyltransferase [Propionibacterium freudenreichii]